MNRLLLSVAAGLLAVTSASAAFSTTLFLSPPGASAPGVNNLDMTVDLFGSGLILGNDNTELSGSLDVEVAINPLGEVVSIGIASGNISLTDFTLSPNLALSIVGTDVGSTIFTDTDGDGDPPFLSPSTVTGGTFAGSEQQVVLNSGALVTSFGNINLDSSPIAFQGSGIGTIIATPTGNPNEYFLTLEIPIEVLDSDIENGLATLDVIGVIVATGTVTVPEPTTGLFLAGAAVAGVAVRRRRRA